MSTLKLLSMLMFIQLTKQHNNETTSSGVSSMSMMHSWELTYTGIMTLCFLFFSFLMARMYEDCMLEDYSIIHDASTSFENITLKDAFFHEHPSKCVPCVS